MLKKVLKHKYKVVTPRLYKRRSRNKFGMMSGLFVLMFLAQFSKAQTFLSLEEAITIGLEKNYQVIIDSANVEAADINNSLGNAGFLPRLDLIGDVSLSGQTINQKFATGSEINNDSVSNKSQSAGAYLTWTLFDGLHMFATAKLLRLQEEQAGNISKENLQRLIADIINTYYAAQ